MNVSPEVVAQITRDFDLVGVDARRGRRFRSRLYYGKTPNRVQYFDGYAMFKPLEFEIQCSRCVLWLKNLSSNKDPKELCNLFVNYLTITKGDPRKVVLIVGRRTFL